MEFFEPFRFLTITFAAVMVAVALASRQAWKNWSRSKRLLAWALMGMVISVGYGSFEASVEGAAGGPRSVLIATTAMVSMIATIIAVRDDSKDRGDNNGH